MANSDAISPKLVGAGEAQSLIISVIGAGSPSAKDAQLAEDVGRELARRNVIVVCGGLGGVMEAVCKGAKTEGGTTIGILPGSDPSEANSYVDIPIMTGIGFARNVIVVKTGRAAIAVGGAYGTLSEIGHALGGGIPVIGLDTWDLPDRADLPLKLVRAISPVDAVDKAIAVAQARGQAQSPQSQGSIGARGE